MEFWKGQALGNDYIVVQAGDAGAPSAAAVRALCDRHRGVGGDGVLVADTGRSPVGLRIFNPDGTEAEKSGNGLRIFGAWLHRRGLVGADPFSVSLPGASVELCVKAAAPDGILRIEVDMGRASFRAGEIPFAGAPAEAEVLDHPLRLDDDELRVHLVSLGNPHCVVFVDALDDDEFRRLAPRLQREPAFARGINVQFALPTDEAIEARVWERGAGETLASGSSACAVAAAALRTGRIGQGEGGRAGRDVEVRMPGGSVRVRIEHDWRLHLTGDAQIVYRGEIPEPVLDAWR